MATIDERLSEVRQRMAAACAQAGRPVNSVTLLAVSKTHPAEAVRAAFAAGEHRFGENYVQEAVDKIAALADIRRQVEWHLIGPLQSNKTRVVAEQFDWVHSVDRLKIAERLSEQRPPDRPPLNICLQVNIDGGPTKSGLAPEAVAAVAQAVAALPQLRLRGLMAIPEPAAAPAAADADADADAQRRPHRALQAIWHGLRQAGLALDTLSIGMSADLEAAIAEGSTLVRVGSAIFGARGPKPAGPAREPCRGVQAD